MILPVENKSMTLRFPPIENCMVSKIQHFLLLSILLIPSLSGAQSSFQPVPGGYRDFQFGDSIELVKDKLRYDSYFAYRGDPDVSMMLKPDRGIIDTAGSGFIERGFFLFDAEKLYQITLVMDREKIDFYSIQVQLTGKYGDPVKLDPTGMIWENEKYRISLEYPLSVKYVDLTVFNRMLDESQLRKSGGEVLREDFLETF